jgi:hypothetical protein
MLARMRASFKFGAVSFAAWAVIRWPERVLEIPVPGRAERDGLRFHGCRIPLGAIRLDRALCGRMRRSSPV